MLTDYEPSNGDTILDADIVESPYYSEPFSAVNNRFLSTRFTSVFYNENSDFTSEESFLKNVESLSESILKRKSMSLVDPINAADNDYYKIIKHLDIPDIKEYQCNIEQKAFMEAPFTRYYNKDTEQIEDHEINLPNMLKYGIPCAGCFLRTMRDELNKLVPKNRYDMFILEGGQSNDNPLQLCMRINVYDINQKKLKFGLKYKNLSFKEFRNTIEANGHAPYDENMDSELVIYLADINSKGEAHLLIPESIVGFVRPGIGNGVVAYFPFDQSYTNWDFSRTSLLLKAIDSAINYYNTIREMIIQLNYAKYLTRKAFVAYGCRTYKDMLCTSKKYLSTQMQTMDQLNSLLEGL